MSSTTIDTLEIAHELREAGLPEPQADAIARQFERRYDVDREKLVTRAYLDAALAKQSDGFDRKLEALRAEIAEQAAETARLAAELRAEIVRLERDSC